MSISLFIGRFQPFHRGHLKDVLTIIEKGEYCAIAIGSSEKSHEPLNPLTAKERAEIISAVLDAHRIPKHAYGIVFVPDIGSDELWPRYAIQLVEEKLDGGVAKIYTGSVQTETLFKNSTERKVILLPLIKDSSGMEINATSVRNRFRDTSYLEEILDPTTIRLLQEFDFKERIRL